MTGETSPRREPAGPAPRIVAGGSNSKVYSRTSRPVAHEISRITSTKGSRTPRSLTRRTKRRPSARFSNDRLACSGGPGCSRRWRRGMPPAARRRSQVGRLFRCDAGHFDLGPQGLSEGRLDGEPAQAQGGASGRPARCSGGDRAAQNAPRTWGFLFKASPGLGNRAVRAAPDRGDVFARCANRGLQSGNDHNITEILTS